MGSPPHLSPWGRRPAGRAVVLALVLGACAAPAWLFSDFLTTHRLSGDDVAYIAGSRTLKRALGHLFVPHNTHVVPSLRLVTWLLVAGTGRLSALPFVFPAAAYATLVATILLTGALVARETGRAAAGLTAMVAAGTTSTMWPAGVYYAASQATWAGLGILAVLWFLQGWRRDGDRRRLAAAAAAAWVAGGFWSLGYASGLVGAVYLWSGDGRRDRWGVWVLLAATAAAMAINLGISGRQIDESVRRNENLHGRTLGQAVDPARGVLSTLRVLPRNLVLGNLGVDAELTAGQAITLALGLACAWAWIRLVPGRATPLETAGAAMALLGYWAAWSIRGYLPFEFVSRVYAWYDIVPHLGAVLFASGWWWGASAAAGPIAPTTRSEALAVLLLLVALLSLHAPRVASIFVNRQLPRSPSQAVMPPGSSSRERSRALDLASAKAERQRQQLARFERAEAIARRRGIGRDSINRLFEPVLSPSMPKVNDADLFDLPREGTETDPARIRAAIGGLMAPVPQGRTQD